VKLTDLKSDDVSVSIAGSGDAAVNAQKTLSVSIAGSGDVVYTGDAMVKSSVAGSGSVKRR
jgi:Putative auto-transporter adhesin, head GIN domain